MTIAVTQLTLAVALSRVNWEAGRRSSAHLQATIRERGERRNEYLGWTSSVRLCT